MNCLFEKTDNKQKAAGVGPFKKSIIKAKDYLNWIHCKSAFGKNELKDSGRYLPKIVQNASGRERSKDRDGQHYKATNKDWGWGEKGRREGEVSSAINQVKLDNRFLTRKPPGL